HAERGDMRAELLRGRRELLAVPPAAESRIGHVPGVAVREAEVHAGARRVVELVGGHVVAHVVRAVVGEPQLFGARIPVEADAVADAPRVDLAAAGRGRIEAADDAEALLRLADVARRSGREVEHAVGPEAQGLEAVMALA